MSGWDTVYCTSHKFHAQLAADVNEYVLYSIMHKFAFDCTSETCKYQTLLNLQKLTYYA